MVENFPNYSCISSWFAVATGAWH